MSKFSFDTKRPLSWSSISSFEWNKEQWFNSYILGKKQSSPELTFGSLIDKKYQDDATFMPAIPRYPLLQHKMNIMLGTIPLVGIPDGICFTDFLLADLKTGVKAWTQKRADETGQLTMYLLLIYITKKIMPEKFKCFIHWLPTKKVESGDFADTIWFRDDPVVPITFETKRTMHDLILFGDYIKKTYSTMQEYVKTHD